jgi:hypothetical protein
MSGMGRSLHSAGSRVAQERGLAYGDIAGHFTGERPETLDAEIVPENFVPTLDWLPEYQLPREECMVNRVLEVRGNHDVILVTVGLSHLGSMVRRFHDLGIETIGVIYDPQS